MNKKLQKLEMMGGLFALGAYMKVSDILANFGGRAKSSLVASSVGIFEFDKWVEQAVACELIEIEGEDLVLSKAVKKKAAFVPPEGKRRYGKNVWLSNEEIAKLQKKFLTAGLGDEWVARAVELLDAYFSKPTYKGRTKRDEYVDDYRCLMDWPLRRCVEEATARVRFNTAKAFSASSGRK